MGKDIYVVVGEGGVHKTLVGEAGPKDQPEYEFQIFLQADDLDMAVSLAAEYMANEGWQGIDWQKGGIVDESMIDEEVEEAFERAVAGEVAAIIYASSGTELD
ncbi:hypothetical protein [Pararhizobium sp. IMCC21322]|uniref:hypothetical protein n=1 Tax=Pararhizobium sp. IMCC21322 TaxID=3067903 RepID=UPI0027405F5C|nr:hypothetical protein [Pararhizobium sp. IMCC21322]